MPFDPRDSRLLWGGPVRAVHVGPDGRGDREIRGWGAYIEAEDWIKANSDLSEWEIKRDRNPAWGLHPAVLPGPDGRLREAPSYDTPDGKPAGRHP